MINTKFVAGGPHGVMCQHMITQRTLPQEDARQKSWTGPRWLQEPSEIWPVSKVGLTNGQKEALCKEVKNEYRVMVVRKGQNKTVFGHKGR